MGENVKRLNRYIVIGEMAIISEEIVGFFDLDKTTVKKDTRQFLNINEGKGLVETVGYDIPLSFIVTDKKRTAAKRRDEKRTKVILSPISPATLGQRAKVKS